MDTLSVKDRTFLKQRAHHLHAVVMIGQNGLTDAIINETHNNLLAHELIKVQVAGDDRQARIAIAQTLCQACDAQLVQHIGKQLVLWRKKPE